MQFKSHYDRIGSLAFYNNLLASGSRDKSILVHDIRVNNGFEFKKVCTFEGHE